MTKEQNKNGETDMILFIIGLILAVVALGWGVHEEELGLGAGIAILPLGIALIGFLFSSYGVPTGKVGVEQGFGGNYTGKVVTKTGFHAFGKPMTHHMEKVDVRNDKTVVKVDVMKDRTYNVHAKMEVVYDLDPNKVVNLLTNNPKYKSTVIGSTVKQVVTENNSLADSQTLSETEQKIIKDKLDYFGIKVTNIYMDSYQLTNTNNFAINANGGQNNN